MLDPCRPANRVERDQDMHISQKRRLAGTVLAAVGLTVSRQHSVRADPYRPLTQELGDRVRLGIA